MLFSRVIAAFCTKQRHLRDIKTSRVDNDPILNLKMNQFIFSEFLFCKLHHNTSSNITCRMSDVFSFQILMWVLAATDVGIQNHLRKSIPFFFFYMVAAKHCRFSNQMSDQIIISNKPCLLTMYFLCTCSIRALT